jgi:hypothetical protein
MKRTVEVEVDYCDVCGKENGWRTCIECNKCYCSNCADRDTIGYWSGTYGGHQSYVCRDCNAALIKGGKNEYFNALLVIERLRNEYAGFYADYEPRKKVAEALVQRLEEARKKE